jgi:hypothetical protein
MNVTFSRKNLAFIAKYAALTGYTREEFASLFLADYFKMFENTDGSFLQETIGSMYFKDRESAERVQAWLIERVSKYCYLNSIETTIDSNADGTFGVSMTVPYPWSKSGRSTVA